MTQYTPQQSTPQHTAAQQPAPYGRPGAGGPALTGGSAYLAWISRPRRRPR